MAHGTTIDAMPPPAPWVIRPERPGDHADIAALVAEAFGSPVQASLVDEIRKGDGYLPQLALVAEVRGRVVGHVMVSRAVLVDGGRPRPVVTLSPLAVDAAHRRRGIGAALVREVTALADAAGEPVVVLEGDPRFYRPLGFEPAAPLGISVDLPSWAPPEAAQVLRLAAYDPSVRGRLVFDALDRLAHTGDD